MTEKEKLIYLAGIVDGEGCFWRGLVKNGRGEARYQSRLMISTTTDGLADWIKDNFDMRKQRIKRSPKYSHWSDYWSLIVTGKRCEELALRLLPYLIVKQEQVKRVLIDSDKYLVNASN